MGRNYSHFHDLGSGMADHASPRPTSRRIRTTCSSSAHSISFFGQAASVCFSFGSRSNRFRGPKCQLAITELGFAAKD